jgi:rubrerythrin
MKAEAYSTGHDALLNYRKTRMNRLNKANMDRIKQAYWKPEHQVSWLRFMCDRCGDWYIATMENRNCPYCEVENEM